VRCVSFPVGGGACADHGAGVLRIKLTMLACHAVLRLPAMRC